MKTVIIGGVAGGASCAARLRRMDEKANIVLLEKGPYISYANCGLPYYVGDVIQSRDALLVTSKAQLTGRFNIDVREMNEALSIDRAAKKVQIRNNETGEVYEENYDKLVIATGSSPIRPRIEGIDDERIRTVWTVPDSIAVKEMIAEKGIKDAVVVGGGFIGLEMAENLHTAGLKVSLVEAADQVMAPLDIEMAHVLHGHILSKGVDLHLGDGVARFESGADKVKVVLGSGESVEAALVILAIGVRANSKLAADAGLEINARGGIVVNDMMQTADPDVYAVGDAVQVKDFNTGDDTMVALAGPANKQGRIAANNIAGREDHYQGTQGSSVARVFDMTAASTGLNEKTLISKNIPYKKVTIVQNSHAGYYPGAKPMTIKLLFAPDGSRILGGQIVGYDGVDKRIDTIGTSIRLHATVEDLTDLELAYAPPYSSAKDPVNMAGFAAQNLLNGDSDFADWDVDVNDSNITFLDVREDAERLAFAIPTAVAMPFGQVRDRLGELDPTKPVVVFCGIGVRAHSVERILRQSGFDKVSVYPGGMRFYRDTHYDGVKKNSDMTGAAPAGVSKNVADAAQVKAKAQSVSELKAEAKTAAGTRTIDLNCCGLQCPGPIMKVHEAVDKAGEGDVISVTASDPGFAKDIISWCEHTGNTLISNTEEGGNYVARISKGVSNTADQKAPVGAADASGKNGMSIIVFDGDMDKVMASFILANGAASMGMPVTMFFTFWGLAALRKDQSVPVDKTAMEKMFGAMLPQGASKLGLSKMNMAGMGAAMMKKIMKDKNVSSVSELMASAIRSGVRIIACSMSMDVMGIKKEELINGVEIAGVGTYLGEADKCSVNLFI